ncbi:hypothetical protein JW710_05010 [Candidatus Dojkabacteria bacterium]|nr:hypothetical protein [Candidatus Dojkabacteria bacterium]
MSDSKTRDTLLEIGNEYVAALREILPDSCTVQLGGSLVSTIYDDAAYVDEYEVDIRIVVDSLLAEDASKVAEEIRKILNVKEVRFLEETKIRPYRWALSVKAITDEMVNGKPVELDIAIWPKGSVEYACYIDYLPANLLEQYVGYRKELRGDRSKYKKMKTQFYSVIRCLYDKGYWAGTGVEDNIEVVGNRSLYRKAVDLYWGENLDEILSREVY